MKYVYPICAMLITVSVLVLSWDAHKVLQASSNAIQTNSQQVTKILGEVHNATQTFTQAAEENKIYYNQIARQAAGTERATRLLIDHFDRRTLPAIDSAVVNTDRTIGRLSIAIDGISRDSEQLTRSASADLDRVGGLIQGLSGTNAQLQARIGDPQITELIGHLDMAALHFSLAAQHTDETMNNVALTTDYYRRKLTTPLGFWRTFANFLFDGTYKSASIYGAIH